MIRGQCLCGAIRFAIDGPLDRMAHCHCSICRKASGAVFQTFVACRASDFRWLAGKDERAAFESSPGVLRSFCPTCGSSVPTAPPSEPEVFVPAGTLQGELRPRRVRHIFTASKASWFEITDPVPQFQAYPTSDSD